MDNIELVTYLAREAANRNVNTLDELHQVIEDSLTERMNSAVKLVQLYDSNAAYADLLKDFVFVKLKSKENG